MALSLSIGSAKLLQIGVSLSDVALLFNQGKKAGNWFRVASNDDELLSSIGEKLEALLRRRDLLDVVFMERRWSRIDFIYQGHHHDNSSQVQVKDQAAELSSLSWLMVTIVTALDLCLPSTRLEALIRAVFVRVLDRDKELEDSLRVLLPTNIVSWRETGIVRSINTVVSRAMKACRFKRLGENALPQLNPAETKEMEEFLVWLLSGGSNVFDAMSVIVFAVAAGMEKAGVQLRTEGKRMYETEPFVHYVENSDGRLPFANAHDQGQNGYSKSGIGNTAQQIAYPWQNPSSMVNAMPANRATVNKMSELWELGSKAAFGFRLHAEAEQRFSLESEVYYTVENLDISKRSFAKEVLLLSGRSFPERSDHILLALETLAIGIPGDRLEWLHQHTELGFLQSIKASKDQVKVEDMELWLQYQSLVFGFYYKFLEQLVSTELILQPNTAYFKGVWGEGSTMFLSMCVEFGDIVRREGKISRTHILYMLSTMYNGRQKSFAALSSTGKGLLGILGSISVLTRPLLRSTDVPEEIASFMIVDRPILDLVPDRDGELVACAGGGIDFGDCVKDGAVAAHGTLAKWSLHAKMGIMFGDGLPGVVMAARCGGRLVGWFNPLAADIVFLSPAYIRTRHKTEDGENVDGEFAFSGFEVRESDWQAGTIPMPGTADGTQIGIVQSKNCPALRYAAAGIYNEAGWEVAIITNNVGVAHDRVHGEGIIIA